MITPTSRANSCFRWSEFEPKNFRQRRPDGAGAWLWQLGETRRVVYRLPDLLEAVACEKTVFIAEGEKDVDALTGLGVTATCNPGGAEKWRDEYSAYLKGADVVIIPDKDAAGEQHLAQVSKSLAGVASKVRVLRLPTKDAHDWIAAGGTADQLWQLVGAAPSDAAPPVESTLETFCAADLDGVTIPPREWLIKDVIPHLNVTILSGDGGLGKSILALQLGMAMSARTQWLGMDVMQGPLLYLGAEDDKDEIERRVDGIRREMGCSCGDLADFHYRSLVGEDALLATFDNGAMRRTKLLDHVEARIGELGAIACVIDTSADAFGGDEINRTQVRQFISMLRGICIRKRCTILLLAHPSLAGMASGSGTSGSTGWNNSARSRLYLEGVSNEPDTRLLNFKKLNYGPRGKPLRLRWQNGLFRPDDGEKASASARANAEFIFMNLLDAYTAEGRNVGSSTASTYAPKVFAADRRSKGIGRNALRDAMNALFERGEIINVEFGPPSHRRKRIIRTGEPQA